MLDASLCERGEFAVAYCRVFLSVLYDCGTHIIAWTVYV